MSDSEAARPRVWIVEDSRTDAEYARAALGDDYDVRWFRDGASMLEAFVAEPVPDLLLLDVLMPGMSGIDVCKFVRSSGRTGAHVGILVLTAQRLPSQIADALDAEANDYLCKPYADLELRARVAAVLRGQQALARASAAEERLERLLASAPDAIIAIDASEHITYVNDEAVGVLGESSPALRGRRLRDVLPLDATRDDEGHAEPPDIAIGDRLYSPTIRNDPGRAGLTVALRDVTAVRDATRRQLDYYSIIAHDLRSPLQAMLLRTDLIRRGQRGSVPAQVLADIQKIEASLRNQLAMINDFLDLARMESGRVDIEREVLSANDLLTRSLDELQPLLEASRIEGVVELPQEPVYVVGDRARLDQVCINLLANAIKFTPPGKRLSCRLFECDEEATIEIQDEGPGIDPSAIPTLFGRYTRVLDDNHQVSGSGLGLMIVREIVEAHGGTVGVRSRVGEGSTFWFRLPCQQVGTVADEIPRETS